MTVLVIDVGSSSVRVLLFDDDAMLIPEAVATRQHQFATKPPGAATIEATDLQVSIESCIDEILLHPRASDIHVVGMATFVGNVLGVDSGGNPLTPVYAYSDTRSADDVEHLKANTNLKDTHQRTGCMTHTAYLPGRLRWLRRTEPQLFDSIFQWVDVGTYLYMRWFGQAKISYSIASWSGMLNRQYLQWDEEWLSLLNLGEAVFPVLADYDSMQIGLTTKYGLRWPRLKETPFCLAVGDGAAANVGSGCVDDSHIALTVGTTAALRIATNAILPQIPDGLWGYRATADLHLIGGATSEGGNIYQWVRSLLALDEGNLLEPQIANREPGSHGLTFLPLLLGERSPGWATDATGGIVGLRLSTTPIDMLQAALEGVAHRLALIAEQLQTISKDKIVVVGGGGALEASPVWTQIIANAINAPIHITSGVETTARGVAVLALAAIGKGTVSPKLPEIMGIVYPQPENALKMRAARMRQVELYRRLVSTTPLV